MRFLLEWTCSCTNQLVFTNWRWLSDFIEVSPFLSSFSCFERVMSQFETFAILDSNYYYYLEGGEAVSKKTKKKSLYKSQTTFEGMLTTTFAHGSKLKKNSLPHETTLASDIEGRRPRIRRYRTVIKKRVIMDIGSNHKRDHVRERYWGGDDREYGVIGR